MYICVFAGPPGRPASIRLMSMVAQKDNGTKHGTRNGTKHGTRNGTKHGTRNGTKHGTRNGTKHGPTNGIIII